jgi:CPA1 family monovalent cation:H+ antiporter
MRILAVKIWTLAIYHIIAILIFLTSVFAYVNERWIKWPPTIGIMVLSLFSSLVIVIFGKLVPDLAVGVLKILAQIDFEQVLMKIMLSFLLFAGAIQIDARKMRKVLWPVLTLSTAGVLISTIVISILSYYTFLWLGIPIAYTYCLLFGALISPTDPIAVMAILRKAGIPQSLELKISGESLFNDGVGVVLFMTILATTQSGPGNFSITNTALLFLQQAGGGLLYGTVLGYLAYYAVRSVSNYKVEVMITLAIVMCGYAMAEELAVSGPLAIIIAGMIMGTKARISKGISPHSREYMTVFWELTDEIFNAVLFMLLGLELLVIKINLSLTIAGACMVAVVLFGRWLSVWLPLLVLRLKLKFEKNTVAILTWGGLRGGLSVAMALSLPKNMHRDELVLVTYIIVVFSIIIQGLTIGKVSKRLLRV